VTPTKAVVLKDRQVGELIEVLDTGELGALVHVHALTRTRSTIRAW
jgi:hypothetical protein